MNIREPHAQLNETILNMVRLFLLKKESASSITYAVQEISDTTWGRMTLTKANEYALHVSKIYKARLENPL